MTVAAEERPSPDDAHTRTTDAIAEELGVQPDEGLAPAEVASRLERYGPNELRKEQPPSPRGGAGAVDQPDEHHVVSSWPSPAC